MKHSYNYAIPGSGSLQFWTVFVNLLWRTIFRMPRLILKMKPDKIQNINLVKGLLTVFNALTVLTCKLMVWNNLLLYISQKAHRNSMAVPTLSLASFYRRTGTLRPRHEGRETRTGHRGNKVKRKAPKVCLFPDRRAESVACERRRISGNNRQPEIRLRSQATESSPVYTYLEIFWIRNFFFPDTASAHMHPANSIANPYIFVSAL